MKASTEYGRILQYVGISASIFEYANAKQKKKEYIMTFSFYMQYLLSISQETVNAKSIIAISEAGCYLLVTTVSTHE